MVNQPQTRPNPVNGTLILVLGILSIVMIPVLGPVAWILGNQTLNAISEGTADAAEASTVAAGRICGIVGTVMLGLGMIAGILYMIILLTFGTQFFKLVQKSTPTMTTAPASPPIATSQPQPTSSHSDLKTLIGAIITEDNAQAQSLIASNPSLVNSEDNNGQTPLFTAAFAGNLPIAKLLIANGANVNAKDTNGQTALDNAVFFDHPDVAKLIKQHGGHTGKGAM